MTVGERIKMRRKELGLSADQVAERVGVNRATIYRYESDEIKNMGTDALIPLAAALRTTPAWILMGGDDDLDDQDDLMASVERLFNERPEARVLFSKAKNASDEDFEKIITIVNTIVGE